MAEKKREEQLVRKFLITGGLGFIASHTVLELLSLQDCKIVIVDNLSNSKESVLDALKHLSKRDDIKFHNADLRNLRELQKVFFKYEGFDAVIHFAGFKAVGESKQLPLDYYFNNVSGTINLLLCMRSFHCKKLIFSSSATVYGKCADVPFQETESPLDFPATNPYGTSKLMIEQMLKDMAAADPEWRITILRYFNPIGAHKSGLLGEDPNQDFPNNLLPYLCKVATGKLKELCVFGNDYNTPDGTGVRDYIHVLDLAKGHVTALADLYVTDVSCNIYNLGTGKGTSVMEMIEAMEAAVKASHKLSYNAHTRGGGSLVPYRVVDRRPGDVATSIADPSKAKRVFGWETVHTVEEAVVDALRFQERTIKSTSF